MIFTNEDDLRLEGEKMRNTEEHFFLEIVKAQTCVNTLKNFSRN